MIESHQRRAKSSQLPSKVKQQLRRLPFHRPQRLPGQITQYSHQLSINNDNLLTQTRQQNPRTKRNPLRQTLHHRILRLEHLPLLSPIRDLQHKLLPITRRKQKISIALARQLARTRLNTEILLGYSLCENRIHRFHQCQIGGVHASAHLNAASRDCSSPSAINRQRVLQQPALSPGWTIARR